MTDGKEMVAVKSNLNTLSVSKLKFRVMETLCIRFVAPTI